MMRKYDEIHMYKADTYIQDNNKPPHVYTHSVHQSPYDDDDDVT